MFDFDAGKLLVIGVVALIVIGPKDLPRVLRQLGQTVAQLRRMASEFQSQFMEAIRETELEDIRDDVAKLREETKLGSLFNPIETVRREISGALADRRAETPAGAPALGLDGLKDAAEDAQFDFAATSAAPTALADPAGEGAGAEDQPKPPSDESRDAGSRGAQPGAGVLPSAHDLSGL